MPMIRRAMGFGAVALVAAVSLAAPRPALAWWNGGVWVSGPGYWPGPVYAPPVVVAPPPVYYAPPPVVYAPPAVVYPAPAPVYFPPQPVPPAPIPVAARSCFTPTLSCPMTVPRSPGTGCYCTDPSGNRVYGRAQ